MLLLLWHGWLPGLSYGDERSSWAASFGQLGCLELERRLGAYPVDSSAHWTPIDYWDADDIALEMSDHPHIWTDGSMEDFSSIGGFEVAGSGVYLPAAEVAFESAVWGVAEEHGDARLDVAVFFCLFLGFCKLSSVLNSGVPLLLCRRTGLVIWVITCCWIVTAWLSLLPLVKDGDLVALAP